MGLSVHDVTTCSPEAIEAVAAAWERLSNAMVGDEAVVRTQVMAPLSDGGWVSKDGKRAVELIGFVAAQLEGVRAESGAMVSILREAATELRAAKESLLSIIRDIDADAAVTLGPDDRITWTAAPEDAKAVQAIADNYTVLIDAALLRATAADMMAATAIRANTDAGVKLDFNAHALGADPVADAIRLKDLYASLQKSQELTPEEMQRVKLLLAENQWDPNFQLTLMQQMGPEGLLSVTAVTNNPKMIPDMSQADRDAIRFSLATSLSGASSELYKDDAWMSALATAGGRRVPAPDGGWIHGYESLNTLIRTGSYDPKFLARTGNDLLKFEKSADSPNFWGAEKPEDDPVVGLLTAMKNNPGTAEILFSGPGGEEHLGQLIQRDPSSDEIRQVFRSTLGELLVSATPAQPTPESVLVLGALVNAIGTNPPKDIPQELQAPVAQILAANIESVHVDLASPQSDHNPLWPDKPAVLATFDSGALVRTLGGIGGENLQPIVKAENAYAAVGLSVIQATSPDPDPLNNMDRYQAFCDSHATVQGYISETKTEEIRNDAEDEKTAAERWGDAVGSAAGGVVTLIPLGGDVAERGLNWVVSEAVRGTDAAVDAATAQKVAAVYDSDSKALYATVKSWCAANNYGNNVVDLFTANMRTSFNSVDNAVNDSGGR